MMDEVKRWFITVDWCKKGRRGIFCDLHGNCCVSDEQHTVDEMNEELGLFYMILDPKSEAFTEAEIAQYRKWTPLAEYMNQWGIIRKEEPNDDMGGA